MRKEIKIGLFGYGVVGQGLHDVLKKSRGVQAEILKICVKDRNKPRRLSMDWFTFDKEEILFNKEINLVVELIDDAEEAFFIVKTAMEQGKNVVSANKKMIARHLPELVHLQREHQVSLLYEGAVCGAIPIIRNLEEYYDNEWLYSVRGIFNGSTNYILTRMFTEGMDFQEALADAQHLGYAESDPLLDVSGVDACNKLSIIIQHAFGIFIPTEEIPCFGIETITPSDFRYAAEKGMKIKLVPFAGRVGVTGLTAFVLPRFVSMQKQLYNVDDEYNGVIVEAVFAEKQFFFGKGAGGHPTGSAVLSDISANSFDYAYEYKKSQQAEKPVFTTEVTLNVYFRFSESEDAGLLRFSDIKETYSSKGFQYIIGTLSLSELQSKMEILRKKSCVVINLGDKPQNIHE